MPLEIQHPNKTNLRIEIEGTIESIKKMMYAIKEFAEKLDVKVKILRGKG